LEAAKRQLNISQDDTSLDDELQLYVDAVGAAVEKARGETIDRRTIVAEEVAARRSSFLLASVPIVSITSTVSVDGSQVWDPSDLRVDASSGMVTVASGPAVSGAVLVTYTAGYDPVPAHYQLAALIILQHLWETQRGVMGVSLGGDGEPVMMPGFAIPRRALELLGLSIPGVA